MSHRVGLGRVVARNVDEANELFEPSAALQRRKQRYHAVGVSSLAALGLFCTNIRGSMAASLFVSMLVSLGMAYVKIGNLRWAKAYEQGLRAHELEGRLVLVPERLVVAAMRAGRPLGIKKLPDALFDYDYARTCELVAAFHKDPDSPQIRKLLGQLFDDCPPNQPKAPK